MKCLGWPQKVFGKIHEGHQVFNSRFKVFGDGVQNTVTTKVSSYADHCLVFYSLSLMPWISSCYNDFCFEWHYESRKMRKNHLKLVSMPHLRIKISFTILSNKRWFVLKQLWTIRMCSFINKSFLYILTLTFA